MVCFPRLVVMASILMLASSAFAQRVRIGDAAPPITLAEVIQSPDGKAADVSPAELKQRLADKIIVVEFWGTWCGPCLASMKSLEPVENARAAAEDGDDFAFLYITDETPEHVSAWLAHDGRRRPAGWVVCDVRVKDDPDNKLWPEAKTFSSWGITGRPASYVLKPDGKGGHVVSGAVHPSLLTLDDLRRVRDDLPPAEPDLEKGGGGVFIPGANRPSRPPGAEWLGNNAEIGVDPLARYEWPEGYDGPRDEIPDTLVGVTIRPSAFDSETFSEWAGWLDTRLGVTAEDIIMQHFRQRDEVLEWAPGVKEQLPDELFDIIVKVPRARAMQYRPMIDGAISAAFGVQMRLEEREVDVYILTAGGQSNSLLQDSILGPADGGGPSDYRVTDGVRRLAFVNGDASWIADYISGEEVVGGIPVIDETGLPDRDTRGVDFDIEFQDADLDSLREALLRRYALTLTPARRTVKYMVLERMADDWPQENEEPATQPAN